MKVNALSRADLEPLTEKDLLKGCQLLMDMKKKSYPVTVEKVQKPLTISNVKSMNENKANNSTPKAKWNNMSKDTTAKSVVSFISASSN